MSVLMRDLLFRGSVNMPLVDGATTGGAVDWTKKINFVDISPTGTVTAVSSSGSDTTQSVLVSGRDSTGIIQASTIALNGTTPVAGVQQYERLLRATMSGAVATGDVALYATTAIITGTAQTSASGVGTTDASITLQSGQGASGAIGDIIRILNNSPAGVNFQIREIISISGDVASVNADFVTAPTSATTYGIYQGMLFNRTYSSGVAIPAYQVTEVRRPFYNAASDVAGGSNRTYYEKIFGVNINTATALTVASVIKQTDPSAGTLGFALTNVTTGASGGLNDIGTVVNRQTAPTGVTAFATGAAPQTINLPNTNQAFPAGAAANAAGAQGVWLSLLLIAGLAPAKTSFTMRQTGQTT